MAATFQPTTSELALSNQIFLLADPQKLGIITGDAAIKVFGGANLSNVQLGEIWAVADADNNGFLTRKGVAMALRLIGWAQKGETPSAALLAKAGPVPQIEGVSAPARTASPAAPRSPQLTGPGAATPVLHPPLLAQDRAKFLRLFNTSGPVNGLLPGDKAREIFLKSKLPYDKLSQIWNLADTRQRGSLDSTDFIIAMYLIQGCMSNALPAVPPTLPPGLYEQASGGVTAHSTGASAAGMPSPSNASFPPQAVQNAPRSILRNTTGTSQFSATSVPSHITGQTTGTRPPPPAIPPRAFPLAAAPPPQWDISSQEKSNSDVFFDQLDSQGTGFIGGEVAGPFLMESGLSDDVLAQVWDLVDTKSEGRLSRDQFAVVMHLINSKLAGNELPATLPQSLIPPSLRSAALAPSPFPGAAFQQLQQPQQPQFQPQAPAPQQDLFLLDDSPPSSAVQPPVQPQFTGPLSQQSTGQPLARQTTGSQQPAAFSSPPVASPFAPAPAPTTGFASTFSPAPTFSSPPTVFSPPVAQHRPAPPPPGPPKDLLGDEEDAAAATAEHQRLQIAAEIGNVQNQLSSTKRTLEATEQERKISEKEVDDGAAQLAALKEQLATAKSSYETESKLLAGLKDRYAEQQDQINKTRQELIEAESDLSAVKMEKTEVGSATLRDKDEVRALQKRAQEIGDETTALKAELEKAKKDARQQKGLLAIAKKQLASAEAERAKVVKELEDTTVELGDDKKELDDTNEAIEKINAAAAVAPLPAAARLNSASPPPALVEDTAASVPDAVAKSPTPSTKSLNPFDKLVRQDSVSGTPRAMSPFAALPFTAAAIPTPPIGITSTSPPPVASPEVPAVEIDTQPDQPLSAASTDPFGLDKFDEIYSTPTENFASPIVHSPPPGLEAFAAQVADQSAAQASEATTASAQASPFPPVDDIAVPNAAADKPKHEDDIPPLKELEQSDDDTSSDEDDSNEKFTHVVKSSDSDDWASAKENAGEAAKPATNGIVGPSGQTFDDIFGESASTETTPSAATQAASASSHGPDTGSPSMLPYALNDPFGMPQSDDGTSLEPPVGEQVPPPTIETVLEPASSEGSKPAPTAVAASEFPATSPPAGLSDFDEAMGRVSSTGPVQFSNTFDDSFDFGSSTFEPAPAAAPAVSAAAKSDFDDAFGLSSGQTNGAVDFPPVTPATGAAASAIAPVNSFDDVFGTEPVTAASPTAAAAASAPGEPQTPTAAKANGHGPTDSISTTETGDAHPAPPHSPATTGTGGLSTPPRQSSPPPPAASVTRSKSMLHPSSPKARSEKSIKSKDSPETSTRTSKLSLSFFGRGKDKKDKKAKKGADQHLALPDDVPGGAVTPAAEDDLDAVKQICAMGFSRSQAVAALEKYGYDVQLATNSLLQ